MAAPPAAVHPVVVHLLNPSEPVWRLSVFIAVLASMLLWQYLQPFRPALAHNSRRMLNNLGLAFFNTLVMKLALPIGLSGLAVYAQQQQWGLLNQFTLPVIVQWLICLLLLDLLIYWQHRVLHLAPWLWRIHRLHHSDLHFDATTALRFHPVEMLLSLLIKMLAVIALGLPPETIIVFEILLSAMALFNHSNIQLPAPMEKIVRPFLVTPSMHRIHHSLNMQESNRNFGFNLSCWDRLFGSYQADAYMDQRQLPLGIAGCLYAQQDRFDKLLLQPLQAFENTSNKDSR